MTEQERLVAAAEYGRAAAAETHAMMDRMRDEAAKVGIDLPALLAADYAARPAILPPPAAKLFARAPVEPMRSRPRLVYSRD